MEKQFIAFLESSPDDRMRCAFETRRGKVIKIQVVQYETYWNQEQAAQRQMSNWADLMKRIIKNPEIADRIPNDANLLFTDDADVVFINGEPRRYSELVRITGQMKTAKSKRQKQSMAGN